MPLFSIIVPVYNVQQYLAAARNTGLKEIGRASCRERVYGCV